MSDGFFRLRVWALGEELVSLRPACPFVVDGITYWWGEDEATVDCIRPMVQVLLDDDPTDDDEDRAQMFWSDPPTEEELDKFVHLHILPAT